MARMARQLFHNGGFNALVKSLCKEFQKRSSKVEEEDNVKLFHLIWFCLRLHRLMDRFAAKQTSVVHRHRPLHAMTTLFVCALLQCGPTKGSCAQESPAGQHLLDITEPGCGRHSSKALVRRSSCGRCHAVGSAVVFQVLPKMGLQQGQVRHCVRRCFNQRHAPLNVTLLFCRSSHDWRALTIAGSAMKECILLIQRLEKSGVAGAKQRAEKLWFYIFETQDVLDLVPQMLSICDPSRSTQFLLSDLVQVAHMLLKKASDAVRVCQHFYSFGFVSWLHVLTHSTNESVV